jgi:uncharacterized membrane protein YsdA (DUF1294 family)/cold shock CspA family protein
MKTGHRTGRLLRWNERRGFGFIQPFSKGRTVFLHISALKDATRPPQKGDIIYYYSKLDKKNNRIIAYKAFISKPKKQSVQPASPPLTNDGATKHGSRLISKRFSAVINALLISSLPSIGLIHFTVTTANLTPLIVYFVMSGLTFAAYANDKSRAQQDQRRISEKTLHLCELAGGWLGGFIAQQRLRHKTRKKSYQVRFWLIVTSHWALWLIWLF